DEPDQDDPEDVHGFLPRLSPPIPECRESLMPSPVPAYPGSFSGSHPDAARFLAQRQADAGHDLVPSLGFALWVLQKDAAHVPSARLGEIAPAVEYVGIAHAGDREELPTNPRVIERAGSNQEVPSQIGSRAASLLVGERIDDEPRAPVLGLELLAGTAFGSARGDREYPGRIVHHGAAIRIDIGSPIRPAIGRSGAIGRVCARGSDQRRGRDSKAPAQSAHSGHRRLSRLARRTPVNPFWIAAVPTRIERQRADKLL